MSTTAAETDRKEILHRYLSLWSAQGEEGTAGAVERLFGRHFNYAEDPVLPPTRVSGMGVRSLAIEIDANREAFPDLSISVSKEEMVEEGDRVTAFWTVRGTHDGSVSVVFGTRREDVEPTGEVFEATGATLATIEGARIVGMQSIWSPGSLLQQMADRHRSRVPAEP